MHRFISAVLTSVPSENPNFIYRKLRRFFLSRNISKNMARLMAHPMMEVCVAKASEQGVRAYKDIMPLFRTDDGRPSWMIHCQNTKNPGKRWEKQTPTYKILIKIRLIRQIHTMDTAWRVQSDSYIFSAWDHKPNWRRPPRRLVNDEKRREQDALPAQRVARMRYVFGFHCLEGGTQNDMGITSYHPMWCDNQDI